ncbi:MAG: glutaredoxin domain-containing protein [Patescibacteria group bacterium]|jgi:glutaredoxin-like YruB-family protein
MAEEKREGDKKVTVFSTPTCPWCVRAKEYLHENGVSFEEVDVSVNRAAAMQMVDKSGEMGVPQLWIGNEVVVGFDQEAIDRLLNIK